MTVEDVEEWPERLKQVTVDDIRTAARKFLVDKNSVTGVLLVAPEHTSRMDGQPVQAPPGRKS
jgi:predicted Zn-dependent peptidase